MRTIQALKKWILTINCSLFIVGLLACSGFPSVNSNPSKNNRAAFEKDLDECKEDHPESSAGLHYKRWADCMNLKGWK